MKENEPTLVTHLAQFFLIVTGATILLFSVVALLIFGRNNLLYVVSIIGVMGSASAALIATGMQLEKPAGIAIAIIAVLLIDWVVIAGLVQLLQRGQGLIDPTSPTVLVVIRIAALLLMIPTTAFSLAEGYKRFGT